MSIAGFYGVNNIGDEGILTAMIQQFSSIPIIKIHVLALEPKIVRKTHNVNSSHCMYYRNPLTFFKATSTCNLFILGGGELIHDYSLWQHPIYGIIISKMFQKKGMIYAVSARPFKRLLGAKLFRNALNKFDIITVRDAFSKEYLHSLGIMKKIYVTADPTLLLKAKHIKTVTLPKYGVPLTDKMKIGVNVRRLCGLFKEPFERKIEHEMAQICDYFIQNFNAYLIFFPLKINNQFSDINAINRVIKLMKKQRYVTIAKYPPDPTLVMALIGEMDLFLGMRLHSIIFALKQGVPTFALSYSPKVLSFMKAISSDKFCISIDRLDYKTVIKKTCDLWSEKKYILYKMSKELENLKKRAELNLILAKKLILTSPE